MTIYSDLPYCVYLTVYKGNKLPPFYIGSSYVNRVENGYHGSVCSIKYGDIWKNELKNNPSLFKTIIIKKFKHRKEATKCENRLQKLLKVVVSPMYVNQSYACINGFAGMDVSGKLNPNYGKKWSKEQRERASAKNHLKGKFFGVHKRTGERKLVNCGNPDYQGICKNKSNPRIGLQNKNKIVVKDFNNNIHRVDITDPRYINGELKHHTYGTKTVVNKQTNKKQRISMDEFDRKIHKSINENIMHFVDAFGNHYQASKTDPRVISGELIPFSKGRVTVKDKNGNTFSVYKTDPRYISGELVHHTKGTKNAYDALTGISLGRIPLTDHRWKSGIITGSPPRKS